MLRFGNANLKTIEKGKMTKITILGSGSFINSLDHFGPGYLLEHEGKKILLDTGQGTSIQLLKLGIKLEEIDYIFITHFHADHTANLLSLILWQKLAPKYGIEVKNKLQIFGPNGINEFIEKLFPIFDDQPGDFYKVNTIKEETEIDGLKVTPFHVRHKDLPEATAYRFIIDGKVFVYSGDSTMCEAIGEACKNADLFIVDTALPKDIENDIHLNSTQVGEICEKSGVKKVVLSHLTPLVYDKDIVAEVKEKYSGETILATDLASFEL